MLFVQNITEVTTCFFFKTFLRKGFSSDAPKSPEEKAILLQAKSSIITFFLCQIQAFHYVDFYSTLLI